MTATSTAGDAQVSDALNAAADGTATLDAAVMLLADSGCWLDREDFTSQFKRLEFEETGDHDVRDSVDEQIRHAVHEVLRRLAPAQRHRQPVRP